jgi:DNA topoisomerase-1
MGQTLILVESPTKAKKIQEVLGSGYIVKASFGHIADLPEGEMGIDLSTMEETYKLLKPKGHHSPAKMVADLKKLAKECSNVIIASDPDREGEAIGWHLLKFLNLPASTPRIEIHEITATGIKKAMQTTNVVNMDMVESQRARRVIDRLLGYGISPVLSRNIKGGKSAGRVQSAALRVLAERDRAIAAFKPEDRFTIEADFSQSAAKFHAVLQATDAAMALAKPAEEDPNADPEDVKKTSGKKLVSAIKLDDLEKALRAVPKDNWAVTQVDEKDVTIRPYPPMVTSTLQQAGSRRFNWSGEKTMAVAQILFENGLITYMRTDSLRIAPEAQAAAMAYIATTYGANFSPSVPNVFKNKSAAQDAHEAIRPAYVDMDKIKLDHPHPKYSMDDCQKLYTAIREAFLCSQAAPGTNTATRAIVEDPDGKFKFLAESSVVKFPGWRKIRSFSEEPEDMGAIKVQKGTARQEKLEQKASQTRPPARYKEDTLTRDLEKFGVGRPSSFAGIMKTLLGRKYVEKKGRDVMVTQLGFKVNDWLVNKAPQYTEIKYTAGMEDALDDIAQKKALRIPLVSSVRDDLTNTFGPLGNSFGGNGMVSDKQKGVLEKMRAEGMTIPDNAFEDMAVAKELLDAYFSDRKPSEKQIALAKNLAAQTGKEYTAEMEASFKKTSIFISKSMKAEKKNPSSAERPDGAPTDKMMKFAKSLAKSSGLEYSVDMSKSFKKTSEFIEKAKTSKKKADYSDGMNP